MLTETITQERLKIFYAHSVYLIKLEHEIEEFRENYNALKSSNFSDVRVTSGSKKLSAEEMYAQCLESKCKKYDKIKNFVDSEKPIIWEQINRLTNIDYKNILEDRYINLKDWKIIALEYFGNQRDYWLQRDFKYHFIVMTWHRRAVEALEDISSKPFLKEENVQLNLEGV